jgi:hypothetical protein
VGHLFQIHAGGTENAARKSLTRPPPMAWDDYTPETTNEEILKRLLALKHTVPGN